MTNSINLKALPKIVTFGIFIFALFFVTSVTLAQTEQIPPAIPPAPRPVPGETNYNKCLNRALLTRETSAKNAYQEFNLAVEPERAALAKAAKPFSGWLAWLNIFKRKDVENFERLNKAYMAAIESATPAKDVAIEKSDSKFTVDQQYCLTHQNVTYIWTPQDQQALDKLVPPRSHGNGKIEK